MAYPGLYLKMICGLLSHLGIKNNPLLINAIGDTALKNAALSML